MSIAVPHFVYRCYDEDGLLLYVGCTYAVTTRMLHHRHTKNGRASRWLQASMDHYEVSGRYATKREARDAEANAILDEQPLFNIQGRRIPGWMVFIAVADYLIPRGHGALVAQTTCLCWNEDGVDSVCYTHRSLATRSAHAEPLARTG